MNSETLTTPLVNPDSAHITVSQDDFDFLLERIRNPQEPNELAKKMMREHREREARNQ